MKQENFFILHPSIKLLCIVIVSSFVGQTGWNGIFFTLFILLPFYLNRWDFFESGLKMLLRIKWLLISILFLYLFLLPEETIQQHETINLLILLPVLYRLFILCLIVFSVNLLLKTTTKEQIISGVYVLIQPLTKMGINLDSFLVRSYLTLDFVAKLNYQLKLRKHKKKAIIAFIMSWLETTLNKNAEQIIIDDLKSPNFLQWLIPFLLCFCYLTIK